MLAREMRCFRARLGSPEENLREIFRDGGRGGPALRRTRQKVRNDGSHQGKREVIKRRRPVKKHGTRENWRSVSKKGNLVSGGYEGGKGPRRFPAFHSGVLGLRREAEGRPKLTPFYCVPKGSSYTGGFPARVQRGVGGHGSTSKGAAWQGWERGWWVLKSLTRHINEGV